MRLTFWISGFISSTKLVFETKELLNFERPQPLEILLNLGKTKIMGNGPLMGHLVF